MGNIFDTQEEFTLWFNFVQGFIGSEQVPTPEGSSHMDLEELILHVDCNESSSVAGPLSILHWGPSTSSTLLIPSIAIKSPVIHGSHNSEEDEDKVLDQLAGDSDE